MSMENNQSAEAANRAGAQANTCPVRRQAEEVILLSGNLQRAMRALRRRLSACRLCRQAAACQTWQDYNQKIEAAIRDIQEEWGAGR